MREMMIDIETLDVTRTAVVLQVGLLVFQGETGLFSKQFNLRPQEQIDTGRTVYWSTIKFWLDQPNESRKSVTADYETYPAYEVLKAIRAAAKDFEVKKFWTKGSFDFDILEDLFLPFKTGAPCPWDFRTKRDLRTELDHLPKELHPVRSGTIAHTGLGDAIYQHQQLVVLRRQFASGNITR